jgi:hypothetical protein
METGKVMARFWSKVRIDKSSPCWEWRGCLRSKDGYGLFSIGRKNLSAPRFAYETFYGPIPKGLNILHSCDNRRCVNPNHLSPGTQTQNIKDCVSRGRHIPPRGEKNGQAKLTYQIVDNIRRSFLSKRGDLTRLAKQYGVSVSAIHAIVNKNRWKQEKE